MSSAAPVDRRPVLLIAIGAMLAAALGMALGSGFRLATRLREDIAAVQAASALQAYPDELVREVSGLRERLEVRAYTGRALTTLRDSTRAFSDRLQALAAIDHDPATLAPVRRRWHVYRETLAPVLAFHGEPYVDSDTAATRLSSDGHRLYANLERARLLALANTHRFGGELAAVTQGLQSSASTAAARLRLLLLAGVLAALVLAAIAAWLLLSRARHERAAQEARERTRDILRTVREGFFLLDAEHRIGSVWSDALTRMFGREDFAGLGFRELLAGLVPAPTIATALKYVDLLWGDRANENLMKTINPLSQVEARSVDPQSHEPRYLQFDFHRVTGLHGVKYVLCSVVDVTSNVALARELQESQNGANAQLDMLIGMTRTDPLQLASFLDTADAGLQLVNAILKEPARSDAEFRRKLGGLMRELHTLKGEASALELGGVAERLHALESRVSGCESRATLTGDDFLPIVAKLDELVAYLRGIREIAARLELTGDPAPASPGDSIAPILQAAAARLAAEHRKALRIECAGFDAIPPAFAKALKDCLVQLVRNAAVHGIEDPELRRTRSKSDVGLVSARFARTPDGYELTVEDDGAGIAPDTVKAAAVRSGLITEAEAAAMDTRAAIALIFRAGFSTMSDVSLGAGRGVGMDVVARTIRALGGRIGVATAPGKYTRFRIHLPPGGAAATAVA
ncbi:MAG: Hpt domain-containing protein [Gammaproteobacteria bacterium]|nr:Hpt domain-containing protein [Gammaproteobacteria bacterium]